MEPKSSRQSADLAVARVRTRAHGSHATRPVLTAVLIAVLAGASIVTSVCRADPLRTSTDGVAATGVAPPPVIVLARHAVSPRDSVDRLRRRVHPAPIPSGAIIDGEWSLLSGPLDPPQTGQGMLFRDARTRQLILIHGEDFQELWALSFDTGRPSWQRIPVTGSEFPAARSGYSAVYDSLRDRVVMFGGAPYLDPVADLWELTLGDSPKWAQLSPSGPSPAARSGAAAIYDPVRDRMVLFGGGVTPDYEGQSYFADVWALALGGTPTWNPIATDGTAPSARVGASAVYDPWNDRLLLFGGWNGDTGVMSSDTWSLALGAAPAWSQIATTSAPPRRQSAPAIVDPATRRMLISGGNAWQWGPYLADTWALPLADVASGAWAQLATTGNHRAASAQASLYLPEHASLLQFGGPGAANACFELSLATLAWSQVNSDVSDPFPSRRWESGLVVDEAANQLLVYGGWTEGWNSPADLWGFPLSRPAAWRPLPTTGAPASSASPNLVYDSSRRRLISFDGGSTVFRGGHPDSVDLVSAMSLDEPRRWEPLAIEAGVPPGRGGFSVAYDPKRDRVLLFGGASYWNPGDNYGEDRDDLWQLSLRDLRWTPLVTVNSPGARRDAWAGYDSKRDRLLIVAGATAGFLDSFTRLDSWELPLGADTLSWEPLGPDLPASALTYIDPDVNAVVDPVRDRLLLWDGADQVLALPLESPTAWMPLQVAGEPPTPRTSFSIAYDGTGDRMLAYGGSDGSPKGDLFGLAFSRPVGVKLLPPASQPGAHSSHLEAAVLASANFSPDSVLNETVTLAGVHALVHSNGRDRGKGRESGDGALAPQWRDVNGDGRLDLVLSFPADSITPGRADTVLVLRGRTTHFEILGRAPSPKERRSVRQEEENLTALPSALRLDVRSPAVAGLAIGFELPGSAPVRVDVFDLAGRRVLGRTIDAAGGEARQLTFGAGALPPGLYLVRLQQADHALTARVVVLR